MDSIMPSHFKFAYEIEHETYERISGKGTLSQKTDCKWLSRISFDSTFDMRHSDVAQLVCPFQLVTTAYLLCSSSPDMETFNQAKFRDCLGSFEKVGKLSLRCGTVCVDLAQLSPKAKLKDLTVRTTSIGFRLTLPRLSMLNLECLTLAVPPSTLSINKDVFLALPKLTCLDLSSSDHTFEAYLVYDGEYPPISLYKFDVSWLSSCKRLSSIIFTNIYLANTDRFMDLEGLVALELYHCQGPFDFSVLLSLPLFETLTVSDIDRECQDPHLIDLSVRTPHRYWEICMDATLIHIKMYRVRHVGH
jgi:hypothetical protein